MNHKSNVDNSQMEDLFESQTDEEIDGMNTDELLDFVRPYNLCFVDTHSLEIAGWKGVVQYWACITTKDNMNYEQTGNTASEALRNMAKYMIKNHIHRRGN